MVAERTPDTVADVVDLTADDVLDSLENVLDRYRRRVTELEHALLECMGQQLRLIEENRQLKHRLLDSQEAAAEANDRGGPL